MSANWGDGEVRDLLDILAEDEIDRRLAGTMRRDVPLETLAQRLQDRGYARDEAQVTSKLKSLRERYHQVRIRDGRSGRGRLEWPYFDLCRSIWGTGGHRANPPRLLSSMAAPASSSFLPPSSSSSSDSGDAGVDMDDSSGNRESAPHYQPENQPPPKRRKLSKTREVFRHVSDLMQALAREEEERDRRRMETLRAHEAQLREYQEERAAQRAAKLAEDRAAREAARAAELATELAEDRAAWEAMMRDMIQSHFSLLRDLVARMPAPAPQHPAPAPQHPAPA